MWNLEKDLAMSTKKDEKNKANLEILKKYRKIFSLYFFIKADQKLFNLFW